MMCGYQDINCAKCRWRATTFVLGAHDGASRDCAMDVHAKVDRTMTTHGDERDS